MRKLFTLAAAVLASLTMMAQTTLATFEVNLTADPTAPYASYSDDDATYTCNKVGSSNTSNYYQASSGKYYLKLTGNDAYIQIKLTSGSFAADDTVFYALNHADKKTGIGFIFSKSSATTTVDMTAGATEVIGKYALKATDIEDDGSIKMLRANSNTFVNRIYVVRPAAIVDPVAVVTIAGPTRGTKDYAATFSATTDVKADAYQWFVNDVEQTGATAKTFEFTPTAAGDYSIVCKARNANNATDEWIASSPIAFKALNSLCGEIIKATLTSGSAATVTGVIGGTADVSLSSSKKMDKGKYFGITLKSGNFQEGDTVVITMTTAGTNYPCLFGDKERTNCLFLATETSSDLVYKIVLPAAANSISTLYVSRGDESDGYKWNPVLASMAVIRPMATKSVSENLSGAKVGETPLSLEQLNVLVSDPYTLDLEDALVDAPIITFTKHVTTIYEDDSQSEKDVNIEVLATEVAGKWSASATIAGTTYTINTTKQASFVVTYMDGTTELGTENVEPNGHPANYANFQNKSLATFVGWYSDPELENAVDMSAEVITAAKTYYAKFEDAYATSINFEKAVMENGKGYGIIAQLGTLGYSTGITGSLDSLDNSKADKLRNYAYLGLKVKQAGAMLNFRLAAGNTVKIKFGNIATTPQVSIDGGAYADMTITDKVYAHTATANEIISIKMANGNAVVFQQIMIGEELQAPELFAITCSDAENGSVSTAYKLGIPGENVTITATPANGYIVDAVTVNGEPLVPAENVYSFVMPAEAVTVAATFKVDPATAIDNTEAEVKAIKVIENGQFFIIKNGIKYNANGAIVK